jgi:hypothetical protein
MSTIANPRKGTSECSDGKRCLCCSRSSSLDDDPLGGLYQRMLQQLTRKKKRSRESAKSIKLAENSDGK